MRLHLDTLYQSSLTFLGQTTLNQTYTAITREGMKLVGGEYASIFLKEKKSFKRVYFTDPKLNKIKLRKNGFTTKAFHSKDPLVITSTLLKFTKMVHPQLKALHIQSDILIPLSFKNKSMGVVSIMSTKRLEFDKNDLVVLKLFGQMATLAIKKAQDYTDTKHILQSQNLFISMAGHEFRTPITTIFGYAQLLQQKMKTGKTIDSKWIDAVANESLRLTKLINEFLQTDQIKKGELIYSLKMCDIREIANRVINDFRTNYPETTVKLHDSTATKSVPVRGDYDKLIQIFYNILSNARKYSPSASPITFLLKSTEGTISIEIIDHGAGIPEKELPHIFRRFYRGTANTHEGMGLGLYLTKKIVEHHDGKIYVRSKVNKGTTVGIKLPIAHSKQIDEQKYGIHSYHNAENT